MFNVGVIGYGYWGPNIVRNFAAHPDLRVKKICDVIDDRLIEARKNHRKDIETVKDPDSIIKDSEIDVIAVITPVSTHYELAKKALLNGKHVFVEKPFTTSTDHCKELIDIAESKNLMIMVDHTFLFTGSVKKIKELVDDGTLGDLYYYDSVRVNLGLFQHDINVVWDLAPHDISIMHYINKSIKPMLVNTTGCEHFGKGVSNTEIAYISVRYENNFIAHFHVNWLSPVKIRQTLVAGNKKMLVWDDLDTDKKIKIYDKGVELPSSTKNYKMRVKYRLGETTIPSIENGEALKHETDYFVKCLTENIRPINDGIAGLDVVRILEASEQSLLGGGKEILINN